MKADLVAQDDKIRENKIDDSVSLYRPLPSGYLTILTFINIEKMRVKNDLLQFLV